MTEVIPAHGRPANPVRRNDGRAAERAAHLAYRPAAPDWVAPYIGIPFADHGRGLDACNCYQLVRLGFQRELGYTLPDVDDAAFDGTGAEDAAKIAAMMDAARESGDWIKLPFAAGIERAAWPEQSFDVVEIRFEGYPDHVGLVVAPGLAVEIHDTPSGSSLLYYREPEYRHIIIGFRRHRLIAEGHLQRPV